MISISLVLTPASYGVANSSTRYFLLFSVYSLNQVFCDLSHDLSRSWHPTGSYIVDFSQLLYHFAFRANPYFLHTSQWIFFPTQSCLLLYTFWANLPHSLTAWITVSSAFPRNLYLLVFSVYSFLVTCSYATITRVLVSHFRYSVLTDSTDLRTSFLGSVK